MEVRGGVLNFESPGDCRIGSSSEWGGCHRAGLCCIKAGGSPAESDVQGW